MRQSHRHRLAAGFGVVLLLAAGSLAAQGISPIDAAEGARFEAAAHAVEKAGFSSPVVVGLSSGAESGLFALLATSLDKGVLLIVAEPSGKDTAIPVEIESDATPADIGVHGIRFEPFLGEQGLVDVIVDHHPFRLEITHTFDRHYIFRRSGGNLRLVCDFDGGMMSSYAKGDRSVTSQSAIAIVKVAGVQGMQFDVLATHTSSESSRTEVNPQPERSESSVRFELAGTGHCTQVKKQNP